MVHKKPIPDYSCIPVTSRKYARTNGLDQYFTGKECVNGHLAPRKVLDANCVICAAERCLNYQKRQYLLNADHYRAKRREQRLNTLPAHFFRQARKRAEHKGVPFSITVSDVVIAKNCECCGQEMKVRQDQKHGPLGNSPTLDRVIPSFGYVPGNIASICWDCNRIKNDAMPDDLRRIADWMDKFTTVGKIVPLVDHKKTA